MKWRPTKDTQEVSRVTLGVILMLAILVALIVYIPKVLFALFSISLFWLLAIALIPPKD